MSKKRIAIVGGLTLLALLAAAIGGAAWVFGQEPTPTPPRPQCVGPGWGLLPWMGKPWTLFDAAAEALGLTPEEFFTELHSGKRLSEIAEAQGVEVRQVLDAVRNAHAEAIRQAIEQAVENGRMTREQADWLLEGLDKGFLPRIWRFRFGPGRAGFRLGGR